MNQKIEKMAAALAEPAAEDLTACATVAAMAASEGVWPVEDYVVALANRLRHPTEKLSNQKERLACLAAMGEEADSTARETLAQHFHLLESLMMRFSLEAEQALQRGGQKGAEIADRYMSGAIRAQVAGLRVLSALKSLRDSPSPPTAANAAPALLDKGGILGVAPAKTN